MTRGSPALLAAGWLAVALPATAPARAQDGATGGSPVVVEPGALTRRADLVGKQVEVEDRVSRFQYHYETRLHDQIYLKREPSVVFELPPKLRTRQAPQAVSVKVRGVLRHEGSRWWCDVDSLELLPSDLDRLNRAVATTAKTDVAARTAWVRWAERRAREFDDEPLARRAREVEAEVIRVEADRPVRDPSAHWLALAERAKAHGVPEPEPSAQAHRGLRAALAGARTADEVNAVVGRIEAFFPKAKAVPEGSGDLARWEAAYDKSPADAYRAAPPAARSALDHRLWADATQRLLERRAADDPKAMIRLADEAASLLPDRPSVAASMLENGVAAASGDVGALRQGEVETLARLYRDRLRQPEKAQALYRSWLDEQRNRRLSPRDAEGRLALADQYEALLNDRAAAVALLRDALAIDPRSREVADAFRRRGFRKVNDEWVLPARARDARGGDDRPDGPAEVAAAKPADDEPRAAEPAPPAARSDGLLNLTPDQVRARMAGQPNRRVRVASQGQVVEQWIYFLPKQTAYITFRHRPGDSTPRVFSYYPLPRSANDPGPAP